MKKLISIGVALALLTMAVVPVGVAADGPIVPTTFAKIPFAIIGSGLELFETIWPALDAALGMDMLWIGDVLGDVAPWTASPLAWSVDMLAWGVGLVADVLDDLFDISLIADALPAGVGDALVGIFDTLACGLVQPWSDNITGSEFDPCG